MIQYFIANETFTHHMDCFCPDKRHVTMVTIHKWDIIEAFKVLPMKISGMF